MPKTSCLRFLAAALLAAGLLATLPAQAGEPVARVDRLAGQLLAVRDDGRPRSLSAASRVGAGDRLSTLPGSYARVALDNGTVLTMGPATTLVVARATAQATVLALAEGQLQLDAPSTPRTGHHVTVRAGDAVVEGTDARYAVAYTPAPDDARGRRLAWLRSSLASAGAGPLTDGPDDAPLRTVLAQVSVPVPGGAPARASAPASGLAPGLYVQVLDGMVSLSNSGGSQNFAAGQFGFTSGTTAPPVIVPRNPGLQFNPPPVFNAPAPAGASGNAPKAGGVDCEVR